MSNLAPQLLVILQEIRIDYTVRTSKLLQNNFRTELEWLNKLFPTRKGSCSLCYKIIYLEQDFSFRSFAFSYTDINLGGGDLCFQVIGS